MICSAVVNKQGKALLCITQVIRSYGEHTRGRGLGAEEVVLEACCLATHPDFFNCRRCDLTLTVLPCPASVSYSVKTIMINDSTCFVGRPEL